MSSNWISASMPHCSGHTCPYTGEWDDDAMVKCETRTYDYVMRFCGKLHELLPNLSMDQLLRVRGVVGLGPRYIWDATEAEIASRRETQV